MRGCVWPQCGGVSWSESLHALSAAMPRRSCGASSTPRLLGSPLTGVCGILGRPIKSGDDGWSRRWGQLSPGAGNPRRPGPSNALGAGTHYPECLCGASLELHPDHRAQRWKWVPARASLGRDDEFWFYTHLQPVALSCPRFMRGIQYAAAYAAPSLELLWITAHIGGNGSRLNARHGRDDVGAMARPSPATRENPRVRVGLRCARHRSLRPGQNSRE